LEGLSNLNLKLMVVAGGLFWHLCLWKSRPQWFESKHKRQKFWTISIGRGVHFLFFFFLREKNSTGEICFHG